ncbi:MAG: nitrogen regulation protein NR(II) [Opitutales bacterium]
MSNTSAQPKPIPPWTDERALFEAAVSYSPDGMVLTEDDGWILLANEASQRLLGSPETLTGSFFAHLPPATVERLRQCLHEIAAGERRTVESAPDCPLPSGTAVEITVGRIPWQDRTILQFNLRDISEELRRKAPRQRSQRIEALGQLAGGIVHDLNNILTAIMGSASLLQMGDTARSATHAGNILKSSQRGAAFLRQLQLFSRSSDGPIEPVKPAGFLVEAAGEISGIFGSGYQIRFDAPDDLPAILADSTQLHHIMMILCANAHDAMPQGGSLTVTARTVSLTPEQARTLGQEARAGEFLEISVRDTGTGIPPEIQGKLFEPFFTTKPKGKGTGLGLATVLHLVRRHHGFVLMQTEVGKGTCFACHFPLAA